MNLLLFIMADLHLVISLVLTENSHLKCLFSTIKFIQLFILSAIYNDFKKYFKVD